MQIEFHYKGESRTSKSLLKKCTIDDVLLSFKALFEISKTEIDDDEQDFDLNVLDGDGALTVLQTPSQQLHHGAIIDIQQHDDHVEHNNIKKEVKNEDDDEKEKEEEEEDEEEEEEEEEEKEGTGTGTGTETETEKERKEKRGRFVVRLRGLPWSARENEITEFFAEESLEEIQIVFLTDGRASGEALVEFCEVKSFQSAFLKNRHHIGHRYIEIFKSTGMEIDTAAGRAVRPPARPPKSQFVIRMRGLPYSATDEDVAEFFNIPKPTQIHLIKDDLGRPSGEGFVEFKTEVDAIAAMAKHRHHMGHRYIELFRSSPEELMRALGLTTGWYNNRNGGPQPKSSCILMRGLPYSCTESDITKFFQEIDVTPIRIHRKADGAEAYVEFYSISDTDKAMTRHRNYIGRRYIELFRVTYEDMARTVGLPVANTNIPASALSINPSIISQQQMMSTSSMIGATAIVSAPLFADTINTMKQTAAAAAAAVTTATTATNSSTAASAVSYHHPSHHTAHSYPTHAHNIHTHNTHNTHNAHNTHIHAHPHPYTHTHPSQPQAHHYQSAHHYAPPSSSSQLLLSAANINALMTNPLGIYPSNNSTTNASNPQPQCPNTAYYATAHAQHSQPMMSNNYSQRAAQPQCYYPPQPYYQ